MTPKATIPRVIQLYVGCMVFLASMALGAAWFVFPYDTVPVPLGSLLVFLVLGLGLELAEHRLATGEAKGSIAFVVYLGTIVAFGAVPGAIVTAVSVGAAGLLNGRAKVKTIFNVSQQVLALTSGFLAYVWLGGEVAPTTLDVSAVPYVGIVVAYFGINSCAVSGVIALSEKRRFADVWVSNTWGLIGYDLVASALGLGVAILFASWGVKGFLGVVVPIVFLRHTYLVNLQLQTTNRELLDLMVKAIEARDPYTSGHSQRVSVMARILAREMGLGYREVEHIATAALLHDVGKIFEEFAPILRKKGKLTSDERALMESHPERSAELVGTITSLQGDVESMVRHHHEKFDGCGYPAGLANSDIPLGSRIIMVTDTADAMTTDRPYRDALPFENVIAELNKYSGRQFDPDMVEVFKRSTVIRRLIAARIIDQDHDLHPDLGRSLRLASR